MFSKAKQLAGGFLMSLCLAPSAFAVTLYSGVNGDISVYNDSANVVTGGSGSLSLLDQDVMMVPMDEGGVVYETVEFINGTEANVVSLNSLQLGEYSLTLTDFVFPNAFEALGVTITSATSMVDQLLLDGETQASIDFTIDQVDSYYLSVFGVATGNYNLGLYGLELRNVSYSPIPLPTPALLMLLGLGSIIAVKRKSIAA